MKGMAMTEAEAKTKWCPFGRRLFSSSVREVTLEPVAANRTTQDAPNTFCLGSGCMGWRWALMDVHEQASGRKPTEGYCGLVG